MCNPMKNFLVILFVSILCACGGDDDDGSTGASGTGNEGDGVGQGGSGPGNEPLGGTSSTIDPSKCGNSIPEQDNGEECDDGNNDDLDGCTSLCEWSCHSDSDCQEDECAGVGSTCDLEGHFCTPGQGAKPDGQSCGLDGSCQSGVCVEHACNNGYQEPGEECDDGDNDDFNGCTVDCKYSCVTGDDSYPSCDNPCDPTATCDDATHACVASDPLDDNTICLEGAGYCSNGMCIVSVCGDGEVQPNEDCDTGDPNAGPGCQPDCTLGICGNGIIEGREQCDDGNADKLDGCGPECTAELLFSPVTFAITSEGAPDYCAYEGNAFGKFIEQTMENITETMQDPEVQQLVDDMMAAIRQAREDAAEPTPDPTAEDFVPMIPLFHIYDIHDLSMTTPDSSMYFGLSFGTADFDPEELAEDRRGPAMFGGELDEAVQLYQICYDDQLDPITKAELEIKIEHDTPVIYSKGSFNMGFKLDDDAITQEMRDMMGFMSVLGLDLSSIMDSITDLNFVLRNINLRMEIDPGRSKIPAPPETASETLESAGHFDPGFLEQVAEATGGMWGEDEEDFELDLSQMGNPFDMDNELLPTGTICGTIRESTLGSIGIPYINFLGISIASMCPDQASQIVSCTQGLSPTDGTCSSIIDLLKVGCSGGDLLTLPPLGEPDADTDGDGTNDSYTVVLRLSVQRRTLLPGWAEGEPIMQPAVVVD